MDEANVTQETIVSITQNDFVLDWIAGFLVDRKAQGLTPGTLKFYQKNLKGFSEYCEAQVITRIGQISPNILRQYLLFLEETGHNPGGVHVAYRTIKAFLRWFEFEAEPDDWKNPIKKVKAPRVRLDPLEPVDLTDVGRLLTACEKGTYTGDRDRAILYVLLDTGARASELLMISLEDCNLISGAILIRQGKGGKPRTVFLSSKSRKAVRNYLKHRTADSLTALWVRDDLSGRLGYDGLRAVITRRSRLAGIKPPSLHSFRRAFAINMLRAGVDVYSLQTLMGHADLQVLRRYLKQTDQDLQLAFQKGSPVDRLLALS